MERLEGQHQKKYIAAAALGFTLTIGGLASAIVADERQDDEHTRNSRAIGALENNYGEKFKRPTDAQLSEAVSFVQNLVNKIDKGQDVVESDEALNVTKELVENQSEIEKYDAILAREQNFQETLERTIAAADLKDTDNASEYTLLASLGSVILGSVTVAAAGYGLSQRPQHQTQE